MVRGFPFRMKLILVSINTVSGQFLLNYNEPQRKPVNKNFERILSRRELIGCCNWFDRKFTEPVAARNDKSLRDIPLVIFAPYYLREIPENLLVSILRTDPFNVTFLALSLALAEY